MITEQEKQLSKHIANTILQQIGGNKALVMTGAYNLVAGKDTETNNHYVSFKIKGSRTCNYIKISLNSLDLYDIHMSTVCLTKEGFKEKNIKEYNSVYSDMLKGIIEEHTKLYLSL